MWSNEMSNTYANNSADRSARLARAGAVGGIFSGFIAALCCLGPPILAALGLGGIAAAASFGAIRPYMIAGSVIMLGAGFYLAYGPMERACRADGTCIPPRVRRWTKRMLWFASILIALFITADWWIGLFV